jgi:hypothetical protein
MSTTNNWRVEVVYPWKLIELMREAGEINDSICFIFSHTPKNGSPTSAAEHKDDMNIETYDFRDEQSAKTFVERIKIALNKCSSMELQKEKLFLGQYSPYGKPPSILRRVVEKDKSNGVVGKKYQVILTESFEGTIGENIHEKE